MRKNERYNAPAIEVVEIAVEQGFAGTGTTKLEWGEDNGAGGDLNGGYDYEL